MGKGGSFGRCYDCKSGRLMLWWGPEKQGCGQQMLKETVGEKAAWSKKGQALAQVGYGTFPLRNQKLLSFIICLTSSCKALHPQWLSFTLLGLMSCYFDFSGCWNPYHTQLSLGTAPVSRRCSPTALIIFQNVPSGTISVKKHSVKMLPAVLN